MSIYKDLEMLEDMIANCFDPETGEVKAEDDQAYQELKKELTENGLERLAKVRANKMNFIAGVKSEIDRLKSSKEREEKELAWIENYMLTIYEQSEKDKKGKVKAGTFMIGTRKSTSISVADNFADKRFIKIVETQKIDKIGIKNALLAGEQVEGASLTENKNLTVN